MEELKQIRRDAEMEPLWQAYEALQKGKSQLRFITGEAGTGKSVLLNMFLEEASVTIVAMRAPQELTGHALKLEEMRNALSLQLTAGDLPHSFRSVLESLGYYGKYIPLGSH